MPKILFLAFTLFTLAFATAGERRFYPCHRLEQPPLIDGKTDDEAWQNIPEAAGFYIFGVTGKYAVEEQTCFKAGWTADALYFTVCSDESSPEKMVALLKDGGDLWMEDSIELFIYPNGAPAYAHLLVNSLGSRQNKLGTMNWEAKTVVGENNWTLEARISFSALTRPAPQEGDEWAVNIARNRLTGSGNERCTSWPLLETGFHDLPNFGRFAFKGAAGDRKIAEENEINQKYVRDLAGKITKCIGLAPEYEKDLSGLLKLENGWTEAETLLKEWQRLRNEASRTDADYRRLAKLCNDLSALRQKSDDCIARGIMETLFGK